MGNKFTRLILQDWRQFREAEGNFDERTARPAGAGGHGRTAILNLSGKHFGRPACSIGTTSITRKAAWSHLSGHVRRVSYSERIQKPIIDRLGYSIGKTAQFLVAPAATENLNTSIDGQTAALLKVVS